MGRQILLLGGGGHCKSVIDSLVENGRYDRIGIIDEATRVHEWVNGIEIVGSDMDLERLHSEGWSDAFVTVGSIGNTNVRRRLYEMISSYGFIVPCIIDKSAVVSTYVLFDEGVFVGKGAIINANAVIGKCAIINSGAIIEHGCQLGDFVHVSPRATLCGEVTVGNDSHIGAGTTIIQQIEIGNKVLIGAGSVVVKSIPNDVKAYGNPCIVV